MACELREVLKTVIISGRDHSFLENYMGHHKALTLVAEHGYQVRRAFEDEWATVSPSTPDSKDLNWREIVLEQMKKVSGTPGSFVEEKAKSIVYHYRAVNPPEDGDEAARNLLQFLDLAQFPMERVSKGHNWILLWSNIFAFSAQPGDLRNTKIFTFFPCEITQQEAFKSFSKSKPKN